ncbi:MAG: DegT/DnrJ/EryC1/StrS family aminotransferase [Candidatus Nitrosopumilus limneticus]|nr:Pyridoxal-5'-phosphate-dependent protein [Candidatus Nitrosopumilus limneticus]MDC4212029.1 DegT/DnrJ/EryC1/StrS family aminotransferase [Candidatus Nitrosopumilus limneticus]MDC4214111.1 DegT/DnrJ/EryC1/StrS family aminotransferase [Candidatus Nitrosopumilus limneticus]MDC4214472.1 DegT/DnrJ/EryC1/StrS family aminotransferase [Candidatus Nitrosopumilus limneticus]MDC4216156.1 DegT/DnrJ/EryC1/StrS family aminotransferase [Candidatus Nitrosopumilus limneticus]
MTIPINIPSTGREEISVVTSILKNGALTSSAIQGGKYVQEFEKSVSSFVNSKYAIAVNSGTAALQAAVYALDIKQGDEVLIPSFTFVATANSVYSTGAKPVFVDILKENFTMDPDDLQKKITKKTKAIVPVHLYGNVAYLDRISEIAKKFNIPIIEDAAQSLGSTFKKKHTGTFFEMGCYSMYPAKVMTAGEGGFIVTNNKKLRDKLLMIRNHGMVKGYDTRLLGFNLRLPEINAAIATVQMKKLPKFLKTRQKNAKLLSKLLSKSNLVLPVERKNENVNWYLYTVSTPKRDILLKKLNAKGIGAASYYPIPVHKTPFYKSKTKLPITEWAAANVLSLPIHPKVTTKNIKFIAKTIFEIL